MAGEPPSPAKRSFLDILNCSSPNLTVPIKQHSSFRGEPALKFSADEIRILADPLKLALVGKFSHGRPSMAALRKSFAKLDLKGSAQLGLLDHRHILIRVNHDEDFLRLRLRKFWSFDGFPMRVFKWTPEFRTDVESPLVPVWVSFDSLPLFLFNKSSLFSLASILGTPLKIDSATTDLSRPSVARVCIEIDLSKDLPKRIWLDIGSMGFWQPILYEDLPKYCLSCRKVGHPEAECGSFGSQNSKAAPSLPKPQWVPKNKSSIPTGDNVADPTLHKEPALLTSAQKAFSETPICEASAAPQLSTNSRDVAVRDLANSPAVTVFIPTTAAIPAAVLEAAGAIAADSASPTSAAIPAAILDTADATAAVSGVPATILVPQAADATAAIPAAFISDAFAEVPAAHGISLAQDVSAPSVFSPSVCSPLAGTSTRLEMRIGDSNTDAARAVAAIQFGAPADPDSAAVRTDASPAIVFPVDASAVAYTTAADVADVPLAMDSAPTCSGFLNPNAPLFCPQINRLAKLTKSFDEALLDGSHTGNISVEPLFFAVKSAEFPSFQLPQFAEFYTSSSFNPPDETNCSKLRDDIYTFSDGDDVPRWPASREVILNSLQSFHKKIQDKFGKRRSFFRCSTERKKWKKLAPISAPGPAMSSIVPPPLNALTFHGSNPFEEQYDDNAPVEYESEWCSASSEEDNGTDFTIPLASEAALMALEYEDFSPPARRKYNKRFRDLPAPMTTRSFRNRF